MPRGLGLLLLLLLVFSCTSGAAYDRTPVVPTSGLELAPSERAEEQRRSLRHVFYRNNEAPPVPSARELRRLDHNLQEAPPVEVRELHDLFGNDVELLAFATRDTDGDGVLDYRISEYRGKFFEGDIDLDGDGIRNVYDVAPYNRRVGGVDTDGDGVPDKPGTFADRDGDGIPDHLDWSRRKAEPLPELQAGLFRDFGVILVERSARFTPELVQAVDDTLRLVFRERMSTLRTIAVEDQLLISPDLGDNGFMLAQTQTLTIYTKSIEGAEPVVLLGLMLHEVAHAWQLTQDFDTSDLHAENKKMHFPPGSFTASLERFGWELDDNTLGEGYHHRLYWPHFYATSPRYLYRGSAPNEWATWFEDVQRESGPGFLRNSPAMTWGMVGPYSLTSPWEWHADQLMASLYNRMARGIGEHHNRTYRNIATLLRARMLQSVQSQWSRFDYRNAVGTSIDRQLGVQFELSPAELEVLVDRYIIPLADLPMLSEALALESEAVGVDKLSAALGTTWGDLREHVHAPLAHKPDLRALVRLGVGPWHEGEPPHSFGAGGDRVDETLEEAELEELALAGALDSDAAGALAPGESEGAAPLAEGDAVGEEQAEAAQPRTGLPSRRGGAGRVGGIVRGEPSPGDLLAGVTGPEGPSGALAEGDVHQAADPVVSLFEQLRRVVPHEPQAEEPLALAEAEPTDAVARDDSELAESEVLE
jgi:hypothetical protein